MLAVEPGNQARELARRRVREQDVGDVHTFRSVVSTEPVSLARPAA
jgi:hypothetical protein